jgi:hypothetical protein
MGLDRSGWVQKQFHKRQSEVKTLIFTAKAVLEVAFNPPAPTLWSYFPNKANKWNFRKHEKTKKNVNFKNYDTLMLRKCKNMFKKLNFHFTR